MSITNKVARVTNLMPWRMRKKAWQLAKVAAVVAVILLFGAGVFKGLIDFPLPEDAGPTELTTYERVTQIEKADFQCNAQVSSVFPVSSYDPGWQWGFAKGGQAYVIFEIVGDLDLCIWADDYTLNMDSDGNLVVDVARIDARRPRIDLNPRVFDSVVYQTFKLSTAGGEKLANANIDRVLVEAAKNLFKGTDSTYIDKMQEQLLVFGANELTKTTCYPQAVDVMEQGVYEHFMRLKSLVGFEDVVVNLPDEVSVPAEIEKFDSDGFELKVVGEETCFVNDGQA